MGQLTGASPFVPTGNGGCDVPGDVTLAIIFCAPRMILEAELFIRVTFIFLEVVWGRVVSSIDNPQWSGSKVHRGFNSLVAYTHVFFEDIGFMVVAWHIFRCPTFGLLG